MTNLQKPEFNVYQASWKVYKPEEWPELYADWFNNFLTVERFAEYYGMTGEHANEIIYTGQKTDNFSKNWSF